MFNIALQQLILFRCSAKMNKFVSFFVVAFSCMYFNMFYTFCIIFYGNHFFAEPDFSENKVYTFDYETTLLSGLPEKGLARAGIRIKSKVEISGIGPKLCLIRVRKYIQFERCNSHHTYLLF